MTAATLLLGDASLVVQCEGTSAIASNIESAFIAARIMAGPASIERGQDHIQRLIMVTSDS